MLAKKVSKLKVDSFETLFCQFSYLLSLVF